MQYVTILDEIPMATLSTMFICLLFLCICGIPTILMLEYIKRKYEEKVTKKCLLPFVWIFISGITLAAIVESPVFDEKTGTMDYIIQIDEKASYQEVTKEWDIIESLPDGTYLAHKKGE